MTALATSSSVRFDQSAPVRVAGAQFFAGTDPFPLRGVTYGTFRPRVDGARFPEPARVADDFDKISRSGFTCVRTYTEPPDDVVVAADACGLRLLVGIHSPDLRHLVGMSRRQRVTALSSVEQIVARAAARFEGCSTIVAFCLGNELPADVVRWVGRRNVETTLNRLATAVRDVDADRLVTYGTYPTTEYLDISGLDFLTVNLFLEDPVAFEAYVVRLQHRAADRPLVIGELGRHVATERDEPAQARLIGEQLEIAAHHGVAGTFVFSWTDEWHVGDAAIDDWRFGLTRSDRSERPALGAAIATMAPREPTSPSPFVSIIVCAHNEERTLGECLLAATSLDYPSFEIIVVDDGSTDSTVEIARAFPSVRTIAVTHGGLGVARNVGLDAARGEIVAYVDADAYPARDWLTHLVRGFDDDVVGAVGGPNLVPEGDGPVAQMVALAPGGPAHVMLSDKRAEHIPGCNMAFRRDALLSVGAFDPVYRSAGDDVDVCWKLLDRDWEIAFRPAAVVFHHRRGSMRAYLRQQRGYGRAEVLVAARHPDRFTRLGAAAWRGRIYGGSRSMPGRDRIYRGTYGTAAFQSLYGAGGHEWDLAHQIGIPVAAAIVTVAGPLALLDARFGLTAVLALAFILGLLLVDAASVRRGRRPRPASFRWGVAMLHVVQPMARAWGRFVHRSTALETADPPALPGPAATVSGGVLLLPEDRPRAELVPLIVRVLRGAGYKVFGTTGWEDHDGEIIGSRLLRGQLLTSCHPHGSVQMRVRLRVRRIAAAFTIVVTATAAIAVGLPLAETIVGVAAIDSLIGACRLGPRLRRAVRDAAGR